MRGHAFGSKKMSALDKLIFFLRKRQIVKRLSRNKKKSVADMGCGYDAKLLCSLGDDGLYEELIGIDLYFDENIQRDDLRFVRNDLNQELDLEDGSVDTVLSLALIEHLEQPNKNLQEIYRILKEEGELLLTTPAPLAKPVLEFMAYTLKIIDRHEIEDHKNYFSKKDLREMLIQAGFDTEKIITKTFLFGLNNIVTAVK